MQAVEKLKDKFLHHHHETDHGHDEHHEVGSSNSSRPQPPHQQQHHPDPSHDDHHIAPQSWHLHPLPPHPIHPTGTYPRLCRLSDSSILCILTRYERTPTSTTRVLQITRSLDHGRTFAPLSEVTRSATNDCDNGALVEISPQGPVILAAFRNHSLAPPTEEGGKRGKPTHFRITVCRSSDGGRTWQYLSQAHEVLAEQSGGMGLWEPFFSTDAHDRGTLHLTYSAELARDNQETFRVSSRDGGQTWSKPPRCLSCHGPEERLRDGMIGCVSVTDAADGRQAMLIVFETTRRRPHFSIEYAVSYDDCRTWAHRDVAYVPRGADRSAGAPQIAVVRDAKHRRDRLVVVFMTDEDTAADQLSWPRNAKVKAVFARDGLQGGRVRWEDKAVTVGEAPSAWPGVMELAEEGGKVMAVFEHRGKPWGRVVEWKGD